MTDTQLRTRIRALVASGGLPDEPPVVHDAGHGFGWFRGPAAPCLVCGEQEPTVAYSWPGGRVAHLHAACDAVWKQERGG